MAQEGGALFAGSICQTASLYTNGAGKEVVMKKFREQIQIFLQNGVDLLIAEVCYLLPYFLDVLLKMVISGLRGEIQFFPLSP